MIIGANKRGEIMFVSHLLGTITEMQRISLWAIQYINVRIEWEQPLLLGWPCLGCTNPIPFVTTSAVPQRCVVNKYTPLNNHTSNQLYTACSLNRAASDLSERFMEDDSLRFRWETKCRTPKEQEKVQQRKMRETRKKGETVFWIKR